MGPRIANLNPAVDDSEVILRTLNAAPNGSVDDAILRFDTPVIPAGSTGIVVVTTITEGTVVRIHRAGLYLVQFQCSQSAANTILVGISLNTTNLTANPVQGVAGVIAAQLQTAPAATVVPVSLSAIVAVSGAQANNAGPGNAFAELRLHGTDGAGAATTAGDITAATAQVQIRRLIGLAA